EQARLWLDTATGLIEGSGYQRLRNVARVTRAYVDWCTGRWDGLREIAAALAEAEQTEPQTVRIHARQLAGLVDLARGRLATARRNLHAVWDEYVQLGWVGPEAATVAAALGRLHLAEQAAGDALQATELVMTMIERKGVWLWAADLAPVHLAALVATGELSRAEDLAEQFADWLDGRDVPAATAALLQCQGIIAEAKGETASAGTVYARAAAAWAEMPHPYNELLMLERHGLCQLEMDEPDRGVAILSGARQGLHRLGARWDAARITRQLREHGVVEAGGDGRNGPLAFGERLTPREVDVLALVAKGLTNLETAQQLFLSPRTVAAHLGRAMRKLQASTRTAAAVAAAEAGLIPFPHDLPSRDAAQHPEVSSPTGLG
ncbi:MAG: LuxR C-terminal-related transcriptional regulator, partial [Natronosporangium sp.]